MKIFIKKVGLFLVPFICFISVIFIVDPYEYFKVSNFIPNKIKKEISYPLNYAIWKTVEFKNNPNENILLGDSRMDNIDIFEIEKITNMKYYNFSYGGGALPELIDTFWFATKNKKLKNVYIGVNFNLYNKCNSRNRVKGAIDIIDNPLLYFSNTNVIKSAINTSYSYLLNKPVVIGKPNMTKEEFWAYQLSYTAKICYERYSYPDTYYKELQDISKYCKTKKINLVFIIFPTHVSLQNRVHDFNLDEAEIKFKQDIFSLARTFDFDYENEMTENKNNFGDPFHSSHKVTNGVIKEVWGNSPKYAKLSFIQ